MTDWKMNWLWARIFAAKQLRINPCRILCGASEITSKKIEKCCAPCRKIENQICMRSHSVPSVRSHSRLFEPFQTNKMQIAFHNRLRKIIKSFSIRWQLSSPLTLLSPASTPNHKSNAPDSSTKIGIGCETTRSEQKSEQEWVQARERESESERLWHTIVLMECFMVYYSVGLKNEQ